MFGRGLKVLVRGKQHQIMSATELDEQRVNGSDLDSATSTRVADFGCFDVVLAIGYQEGEGRKPLHKLTSRLGPCEALKKLLKYKARREHLIGAKQRIKQGRYLWRALLGIAAQRKGPDARVDEQTHGLRDRSVL
jgi:hypothetical protein